MTFASKANLIQTLVSVVSGVIGAAIAVTIAYSSVAHSASDALRRVTAVEADYKELNLLITQVNTKVEKLITLVEERLPKKDK